MSETAIKVEGLGKKYIIGHQAKGGYKTFRDQIGDNLKTVFSKTKKMFSGQMVVEGDEVEDFWALKEVSFEVKLGDTLGIIGRNGAGKSTLLKILSRITEPTTGKVTLKGRVASLLEVGTGFHPELSGRENIFLNGAILGMSRAEIKRKFDEIVDFSGVEKFLDTPVKRYSSGMYVRLAFAVAAHLESEILIVDEVLAVGDADFQKKCLGKMGEVSRGEGRTVLFVSHNMAAVTSLCNKCVLLKNGTLEESGFTAHIIEKYIMSGKRFQGEILEDDIKYEQKYEWAKFKAIRTTGVRGMTNTFGINEEIKVELEYEVLRDGEMILPSMHVLDNLGNCILASFNGNSANTTVDPLFDKPLKKGVYKAVCTIPAFFLNDISYLISCFLVPKVTSEMTIVREALNLSINETGEMRTEYNGTWIGLVRPKLHWVTSKLS